MSRREQKFQIHWPLTRYAKLWVVHAPGMPGTFSQCHRLQRTASQRSRHASRHVRHARAVMHVGIANSRWRGKCSRHSRRMRNPQFCVSGKKPMDNATSKQSALKHFDTQTKLPPICRRRFQTHFSWMKMFQFQVEFHWNMFLNVWLIMIQHCYRQAIIWTNDDLVYWRIYASRGLDELRVMSQWVKGWNPVHIDRGISHVNMFNTMTVDDMGPDPASSHNIMFMKRKICHCFLPIDVEESFNMLTHVFF